MTTLNFSWQRASIIAGVTVSCALSTAVLRPALAATILLDFEGLQNLEPVNDFYNGGTGGLGSTYDQNFGIKFSENSLAIIDEDAGGTGNFGGEPSPDTIAFFLTGDAAVMDVANGFDTGFSFFYSAINRPGVVNVYDELGGVGNLLASIDLPLTPANEALDPTGQFSPLLPFGVNFDGTARSVDFGGTIDRIGFDNITLGSETPETEPTPDPVDPTTPIPTPPSPTPTEPTPTEPTPTEPTPTEPTNPGPTTPMPIPPAPIPPVIVPPTNTTVPEPSSTIAMVLGLASMGGTVLRRRGKTTSAKHQ